MPEFDPKTLIDRTAEQELFRDLVSFTSPARLLTIRAEGGSGKSSLLKRLQYNCRWEIKPQLPACLIELDQLQEPTAFRFVEQVVQGSKISDRFAKFNMLNQARTFRILDAFIRGGADASWGPAVPASVRGLAMVGGPVGERAQVAGTSINQANFHYHRPAEFTPDQEQLARSICVDAFFEDLRAICANQPLVLILDVWEKCNEQMSNWVIEELLAKHCFHPDENLRPHKLAVVIAGRPYSATTERFGLRDDDFRPLFATRDEFTTRVLSRTSLSKWDKEHVKELLILNGYDATESDIGWIQGKIAQEGWTLSKILKVIEAAR